MALKEIPDSRLISLIRWLPPIAIATAIVVISSYYIATWPTELIVSFSPQIVILLNGMYVLLFAMYARFIIRDGWHHCKKIVGISDLVVLFGGLLGGLLIVFLMHNRVSTIELTNTPGTGIQVSTFNKLNKNEDLVTGLNHLLSQRSDIIALQEVVPEEVMRVANSFNYDHFYVTDCRCSSDGTETGLVSRWPITDAKIIFQNKRGRIIRAEIKTEFGFVNMYSVHLPAIDIPSSYARRGTAYDRLIESIQADSNPVIVAGDLNTTAYSKSFAEFHTATNHKIQSTLLSSWPKCSWYQYSEAFCVRIDHIFIPKNATLFDIQRSPDVGSDHRALTATIRLP